MKKMTFKSRLFGGFVGVAAALFAVSCAQGFDDNETWRSDVTGAQLESPALTDECFALTLASDGSEAVKVTWPVVPGTGGYRVHVNKIARMDNGELIEIEHESIPLTGGKTEIEIDGCSITFPCEYSFQYEVSVLSLGNEKLNNSEAAASSNRKYLYYTVPTYLPSGTDLYEAIQIENNQPARAIYVLDPHGEYTINGPLDFQCTNVQMYPAVFDTEQNAYIISEDHAFITFGFDGVLRTAAGLQLKHLCFDCDAMDAKGVIETSNYPSNALIGSNYGYAADSYVIKDPIIMENCRFRQVKSCLFFADTYSWGIEDLRLTNSVVQLSNDGTKFGDGAVFCTWNKTMYKPNGEQNWSGGAIRNLMVKNSTLYNLKDNSKNRMVRFMGKKLEKVFDSNSGSATFENCTISKIMNNKEFANNTPNNAEYAINFNYNICYDVFRLQKFIQRDGLNVNPALNTIWGVKNSVDDTDKKRCATEEDPQFVGPTDQPWDLSKADGGVNFKATGVISSTIGDPRWK